MENELISTSSEQNNLVSVIAEHPFLVPITLGILGLIGLGSKAIEKGRNFKLKFGREGMFFEASQTPSDSNSSSGVS